MCEIEYVQYRQLQSKVFLSLSTKTNSSTCEAVCAALHLQSEEQPKLTLSPNVLVFTILNGHVVESLALVLPDVK